MAKKMGCGCSIRQKYCSAKSFFHDDMELCEAANGGNIKNVATPRDGLLFAVRICPLHERTRCLLY